VGIAGNRETGFLEAHFLRVNLWIMRAGLLEEGAVGKGCTLWVTLSKDGAEETV
jgi:hypothetical protein